MCTQEWNFGSKCSSIFSFLRNLHTVFYRVCANLHSHQQYARDLLPHSHQLLLFVFFSMIATLINMRWYISWWFWFAFPWWLAMLSLVFFVCLFLCVCWPSVFPLWKNDYSDLLPLFEVRLFVFDVELYELFIYVGY